MNYNETGALAAFDLAAMQAKTLLRNFYRKGYNSWRKGVDEAPYAFVIAEDQGDPARVAPSCRDCCRSASRCIAPLRR